MARRRYGAKPLGSLQLAAVQQRAVSAAELSGCVHRADLRLDFALSARRSSAVDYGQRTQQRAASVLSCAGDLLLVCVCHVVDSSVERYDLQRLMQS